MRRRDRLGDPDVIPLVAPCITHQDREYVARAAYTTSLLNDETEVHRYEEAFAEFVGAAGAVAVNSGTNALIAALKASGVLPHDPVQIPSYTCRALLDAVKAVGARPVLYDNRCDIPAADFNGEPPAGIATTVLSHMFGIAAPRERHMIEDATLSLGAVHAAPVMVCSTSGDKMLTTGRGGIIAAQDGAFLKRCRELAYYDTPRDGYRPAYSFAMSATQAALGNSQLRQLPGFIERRREIAASYTERFADAGIECPDMDCGSVFFRYIVASADPARAVATLATRGIEAGHGVNPPLHRMLGLDDRRFPGATRCLNSLLSVPCHPSLTDTDVEHIAEQVLEVCAP